MIRDRRKRMLSPEEIVGDNIKYMRGELGISQEGLALDCNLHPNTICSIENGKHSPTLRTMSRISKRLGVPVRDLLEGAGA